MMRSLALLIVTALGGATGCSQTDCEKACEAAKECPQVPGAFQDVDCGDGCDFQQDQAEAAGCVAEWDTFNACGAANTERACESGTCSAEALAWSQCLDPGS